MINIADRFSRVALGNSDRLLPIGLQWEKGNMVITDHESLPQEKRTHLDGKLWQALGQDVRRKKGKRKDYQIKISNIY